MNLTPSRDEIEEIYTRNVKTIYRVCYNLLKNTQDAEDAVADTFVKILTNKIKFNSAEYEKAFLIRAAINICKNELKKCSRRKNANEYENAEGGFREIAAKEENFGDDEVLKTVLNLPEKYKTAIYLFYFEGYSTDEIAEITLKPPSTIRNHLSEARKILREKLGKDYE